MIYMTKREKEMEAANKHGYRSFSQGRMPQEYEGPENKHLAEAWNAGWNRAREDNNCSWYK